MQATRVVAGDQSGPIGRLRPGTVLPLPDAAGRWRWACRAVIVLMTTRPTGPTSRPTPRQAA